MTVLVEAQGDMINNIETHVRADNFCTYVRWNERNIKFSEADKLNSLLFYVPRSRMLPTIYSKV
jgi:hypothetical protein